MAQGQGRSSGQGVKLLYIRDYLYAYATKEHPKNAKHIVEYLASHGIEASVKTIYNDILRLQIDFGVPVEYNPQKWGYYITQPQFEPYELRLLVDGIQSAKFITQEQAKAITHKITDLADIYTKVTLNRQAFVSGRVRSMNESVVQEADRLHQAIAEDKQIAFRYFHYTPDKTHPKRYSKSGKQYVVSPYALLWNNGNYYLYAYDGIMFRYFRVDRMENISRPRSEQREGKKLYQEKHLTHQKTKVFDMYGGTEYNVKMRFQNRLADAVIDQFGKDIMMIPADQTHFTITVPVEISPTFFAWIATFGRSVKIIGPEPVVQQMRKFIGDVWGMYQDDKK